MSGMSAVATVPAVSRMVIMRPVASMLVMVMIGVHLVGGMLMPRMHGVRFDVVLRQRVRGPALARRPGRDMLVMLASGLGMHAVMSLLLLALRHNACMGVSMLLFVLHHCTC
jgi:hypothetical protein